MIFESFSVILRQISLGVHSYAIAYFPCLTKKSCKNRDFGSFRWYCDKFRSEYIRTPSFIFLVLRKNPSKIEILGLFIDTASNFARSTFVRHRSFSDRATKCVTRFTFNTNFNLCHLRGGAQIYIKQELFKRQTVQAPFCRKSEVHTNARKTKKPRCNGR